MPGKAETSKSMMSVDAIDDQTRILSHVGAVHNPDQTNQQQQHHHRLVLPRELERLHVCVANEHDRGSGGAPTSSALLKNDVNASNMHPTQSGTTRSGFTKAEDNPTKHSTPRRGYCGVGNASQKASVEGWLAEEAQQQPWSPFCPRVKDASEKHSDERRHFN